ncbi:C40 family peptidase [Pengzhenrongella frigida]|uniref:C40 family peptidase n=1 Tax=Pengzhenrongella frigida TaxID=1259133 RepID=UPI001F5C21F2|nr:C40 family peptidase [Cellulomonas sp. HLT2-17]
MSQIPARHRAAGRPSTVLGDLAESATGSLASVGRRSAVVAAASGMLVSGLTAPAVAAPAAVAPAASGSVVPGAELGASPAAVDTSALTAAARAVLASAPVVTVAADTAWSLDLPTLTVVADPPPAPTRTQAAASRSQARAAIAAAPIATGAPAPASANGSAVIEIAARYVGVPYLAGGTTPTGFDCSGFTSYVFAQLGITLPRTSAGQREAGTVVSRADAQPGDLVWHPGHIGIYAGGDQLIDSPQAGGTVQFRAIYFSNPVFIRIG